MRTQAAVLYGAHQPWVVEEVELDPPGAHEVLVKSSFAGLCHSDEHLRSGDFDPAPEMLEALGVDSLFPTIGGHEGAGVVAEVGPGVTSVAPGDHVAASFVPSCGRCHWCVSGRQFLCDVGASTMAGPMVSDGAWRHRVNGQRLNRMAQLGTFAEHFLVHEDSVVKIDVGVSLRAAALVSCGVTTGFGSVSRRAAVQPGEVVVVVGCGGVGTGALQAARICGAQAVIAVDPIDFKRQEAMKFGATHAAAEMAEAMVLVAQVTRGRMADAVILTPGVLRGEMLAPALNLVSKDGRLVCTAIASLHELDVQVSLFELAMYNKSILGSLYGSSNPRVDIPRLLGLYRNGQLMLDEMVTREYSLSDINHGYDDLASGKNIRGIITFNS